MDTRGSTCGGMEVLVEIFQGRDGPVCPTAGDLAGGMITLKWLVDYNGEINPFPSTEKIVGASIDVEIGLKVRVIIGFRWRSRPAIGVLIQIREIYYRLGIGPDGSITPISTVLRGWKHAIERFNDRIREPSGAGL